MKKASLIMGILFAAICLAQVRMPRVNSNPALSTTQSAPSGTPLPELQPSPPTRTAGQSSVISGALRLSGCAQYQITVCAPYGQTLSGGGTIDIYYWPDRIPGVTLTTWAKNPGLVETLSATTRCQTFPSHTAIGLGWIYAAPNAITLSAGSTVNLLIEAVCST